MRGKGGEEGCRGCSIRRRRRGNHGKEEDVELGRKEKDVKKNGTLKHVFLDR